MYVPPPPHIVERKKKEEEEHKKRDADAVRRQEFSAALTVRKLIQRVRDVAPAGFESLCMELDEAMTEQLPKMGSFAGKVQEEAEKALLDAHSRFEQVAETAPIGQTSSDEQWRQAPPQESWDQADPEGLWNETQPKEQWNQTKPEKQWNQMKSETQRNKPNPEGERKQSLVAEPWNQLHPEEQWSQQPHPGAHPGEQWSQTDPSEQWDQTGAEQWIQEEQQAPDTDTAKTALQEVEGAVAAAEEQVAHAANMANPLIEGAEDGPPEALLEAAQATEEAISSAHESLLEASTTISNNFSSGAFTGPALAKFKLDCKASGFKITESRKTLTRLRGVVKKAKEEQARRAAIQKKEMELKEHFSKHDTDGDEMLNRSEIIAFAKTDYEFDISDAMIDKILSKLKLTEVDAVRPEHFRSLKTMISIEKSIQREKEKRAEQEELAKFRARLQKVFMEAKQSSQEAQNAAKEAEASLKQISVTKGPSIAAPVVFTMDSSELSVDELIGIADEAEITLNPVGETFDKAIETIKETKATAKPEAVPLGLQRSLEEFEIVAKATRRFLISAKKLAKETRDKAVRKVCSDMEALRVSSMSRLIAYRKAKNMTMEDLYSDVVGTSGDGVSCAQFITCIAAAHENSGDKFEEAQEASCKELFKNLAAGNDMMSKARFLELTRFMYRVIQGAMLSEGQAIDSKPLRRLEDGELVKSFGLPVKDDVTGLSRLHCQAERDGTEGWVSLASNNGATFLEQYSTFQSCIKETVMTDSLPMKSKPIKRLLKEEVIEVLEFPTLDSSSGAIRLKGKTVNGGKSGWINISRTGSLFLEGC